MPLDSTAADHDAHPRAINSSAVIAGQCPTPAGFHSAARWTLTHPRDLGNFGGENSDAKCINDYGDICGTAELPSGVQQAASWQQGRIRNLGSLAGSFGQSAALAMSAGTDPHFYGYSGNPAGRSRAVSWQSLQIVPFESQSHWLDSAATSVDPNGYPAGYASLNSGEKVCIIWTPTPSLISALPGSDFAEPSFGLAGGYLVGQSNSGPGTPKEAIFFSLSAPAISMQTLSGASSSVANGVNSHGVAVGGYTANNQQHGFVFSLNQGAEMLDLSNRLEPGGPVEHIYEAYAINEDGIITARGKDSNGNVFAVLLLPL